LGLRDLWQKRREWLGVLIFVGVIIVCVAWSLLLNPQHVPLFSSIPLEAKQLFPVKAYTTAETVILGRRKHCF